MLIRQLNLLWVSKDKIDKVDICNSTLRELGEITVTHFYFFLQKRIPAKKGKYSRGEVNTTL